MRDARPARAPLTVRVFVVAVVVAATAVAATQAIRREGVVLRAGPGSFHPAVAPLAEGAKVQVLDERGPWFHVTAGDREGWVSRSAFEEAKSGGLRAFSSSIGSSEASASAETAAVKGFDTEVERAHGEGRGQDWSELAALDARTVSTEDMLEFLRERDFAPDLPPPVGVEVTP